MKEMLKLVHICQSYRKNKACTFLWMDLSVYFGLYRPTLRSNKNVATRHFVKCMCIIETHVICSKRIPMQSSDGLSTVSIDRYSTECTSTRHKTGNYNGIPVFVKFVETESLTLSRNDLLELELVRARST